MSTYLYTKWKKVKWKAKLQDTVNVFVFTESSSVVQLSSYFSGFLENPCDDRKHVFSLQSRSLNKGLNVKPHVYSESSLNKLTIKKASFTFLLIFNYQSSTKKFRNDVDVKQFSWIH